MLCKGVYLSTLTNMASTDIYIYGRHALVEALTHKPKAVKKIFFAAHIDDAELKGLARKASASFDSLESIPARELDREAAHQGIAALVSVEHIIEQYEDFAEHLKVGNDTALVLLDEVQDPHNVGAIIRSAAAFGISGILIPEHNQAQVSGAVVKVSAGMAFRVPLVTIGNVNATVRDLKARGFWIYGLAGDAGQSISDERFEAPTVFVLGNESKGIRQKTRELCDILLSIPIDPRCESLNVSVSAAVAFYAWSVKHSRALAEKGA